MNICQPINGQAIAKPKGRYTGELLLRTRPKIYRQIIRLLSEGVSANQICKLCHVTRETVRAVERREAVEISERKKSIIAILSNVAELGAARMEEKIGKAPLRDAAIATGIATDKMLALTGQQPCVLIANVVLPTPREDEARRRAHHALDEITLLLGKQEPLSGKEQLMLKAQLRVLKIT